MKNGGPAFPTSKRVKEKYMDEGGSEEILRRPAETWWDVTVHWPTLRDKARFLYVDVVLEARGDE